MSQLSVNTITNAAGGNTAQINGMTPTADSLQGFRNRIINGDMRIDQRNAGASVTPTDGAYTLDRWATVATQTSKFTVQQSTTATTGFTNSLLVTSSSSYSVLTGDMFNIMQKVEGFNVSDLAWGTASAQPITVSFWVRSSLTGTFGGAIRNSAGNRSYPFTYTISAANTYEYKTVVIPGDTTGTWVTNNGVGLFLHFGLGGGTTFSGTAGAWAASNFQSATGAVSVVGTSGATFYITGVQLEAGSVATPFERRPYGTELQLCQRYYYRINAVNTDSMFGVGWNNQTTSSLPFVYFPVQLRTNPTALEQSGTASHYRVNHSGGNETLSAVPAFSTASLSTATLVASVASGLTVGQGSFLRANNTAAYLAWSAEL
jgi:hypothetical protein